MTWRRRIATVLLAVLAGMPVTGLACAFACAMASNPVAAHHGGHVCDAAAPSSTGFRISGRIDHDCSAHGAAAIWQAATMASERADTLFEPSPHVIGAVQSASVERRESRTGPARGSPPGTAPPTTTPLVLRV